MRSADDRRRRDHRARPRVPNLKGERDIENIGVAPDIEVENTAAEGISGHDAQLERAVKEALRQLDQHPSKRVARPAPIDRTTP